MAILLHSLLSLNPPKLKSLNLHRPKSLSPLEPSASLKVPTFRRDVVLRTASLCFVSFVFQNPLLESLADPTKSAKPGRLAIANTNSWFQYFGDGFSIRVPPQFIDFTEPEDYSAGLSLYGDKAKPKTFAARFASPDGSEVVSVVIRPSNSLKITFLEAKDISALGSLKEAARIFVPGAATIYSARTIKVKEEEGYRNYYLYEFGRDEERIALVAAVNRGRVFIAGAAAPESKWKEDELKLRSAAISLTVL
ncbi:Tagatose-6-phosphate ketose/aldose isomerase [Hirschfeldia incana]|nr:Tagatose-6-phosphate ketose/aldose isomerase [Hirschfeldia incana]